MTRQQSNLTLIPDTRPLAGPADSGANDRRVTVLLFILIVLLSAASAWVAAAMSSRPAPISMTEKPLPESAQPFDYFPSQYVNQATELEPHIEAF
jgi:hypothetical protein